LYDDEVTSLPRMRLVYTNTKNTNPQTGHL
jgi:hypothetical protein